MAGRHGALSWALAAREHLAPRRPATPCVGWALGGSPPAHSPGSYARTEALRARAASRPVVFRHAGVAILSLRTLSVSALGRLGMARVFRHAEVAILSLRTLSVSALG